MNYYERHLGDYAKDTAHLSALEHGVYTLLLDRYYATEAPIPAAHVYRVAKAISKGERQAVEFVLGEFFKREGDDWRNGRADEEIEKARVRIATAQANGKLGGRPKRTQEEPAGNPVGYLRGTQEKALQTPDSRLQSVLPTSPPESRSPPGPAQARARDGAPGDVPRETETISPAGQACRGMREAGCLDVNPSHPHLLAALAEGVTPEQLRDLALEMPGKRFAYLIQTARSRRVDVPAVAVGGGRIGAARPSLIERLDAITTEPSL